MGKIFCNNHGEQLISLTSPKIKYYITEKIPKKNDISIAKVNITAYETNGSYLVDHEFLTDNNLVNPLELNEDQLESIFEKLEPVCEKCLYEFIGN